MRGLIRRLRKRSKESGAGIWTDLADKLSRSNRARAEVNVSHLNRNTREDDTVVVPGKVLGSGKLDHPVTVASFSFSSRARERIQAAGGEVISIDELLDKNPDGKNVILME